MDQIQEKTPHYIVTLKNDLIEHFDEKIEKEINIGIDSLAVMTAREFKMVYDKMATKDDIRDMATKQDVEKILSHIGRYEIRAQNTENILLQDHKPRLIDLEKEVFA